MFQNMLNNPIPPLPLRNLSQMRQNLFNKPALLPLPTMLKNTLHNQTPVLVIRDMMPLSFQRRINATHHRGWFIFIIPFDFENPLPDVTSETMSDGFRDGTEQFWNELEFEVFVYGVESFLDDVTTETVAG